MAITHRSPAGTVQEILSDATKESTATAGQAGLVLVNPDGSNIGSAVPQPGYTAIGDGRKTVTTAGTAVTLASTTACKRVLITALSTNTGVISVGASTVVAAAGTRRGTPLNAGDSFELFVTDLVLVYLDATVNGEGVSFTYFN